MEYEYHVTHNEAVKKGTCYLVNHTLYMHLDDYSDYVTKEQKRIGNMIYDPFEVSLRQLAWDRMMEKKEKEECTE